MPADSPMVLVDESTVRLLMKARSAIEAGLATLKGLGATAGGRVSLMEQTSAEITVALSAPSTTSTAEQVEPCGGCGETDPAKRCIGCWHQFTRPTPATPEGLREEVFTPTHRHVKSGGYYQVIERAKDITNEHGEAGIEVVIYRGVGGHTWVRRASEFDDGRFSALQPQGGSDD